MSEKERKLGQCPECPKKPFPEKVTRIGTLHEHDADCCREFHGVETIYQCSVCKTVWSDPLI